MSFVVSESHIRTCLLMFTQARMWKNKRNPLEERPTNAEVLVFPPFPIQEKHTTKWISFPTVQKIFWFPVSPSPAVPKKILHF